jgi:ribosome maturation protein Sdo1
MGSTEGNLERIFRLLQALGRCYVFVDEADQASSQGSHAIRNLKRLTIQRFVEGNIGIRLRRGGKPTSIDLRTLYIREV